MTPSPIRARLAREGYASFKAGLTVPAGGTLTLAARPEARGLVMLDYSPEDVTEGSVTLSACHGAYAVVPFHGGFKVKRPLCRVPVAGGTAAHAAACT